jgi:hypothetical protein
VSNPIYIHLHIPRTGGTTLNWSIGHQFDREDDRWMRHYHWLYQQDYLYHNIPVLEKRTDAQQEQLTFITGQGTFDQCHLWLNVGKDPHLFTFVRDPIDRVLSSFNYRNGMSLLNQDSRPFTIGGPAMNFDARINQRTASDYNTLFDWYQDAEGEHNLQCKWLLKSFYSFINGQVIPHKDLIANKNSPEPELWPWWFDEVGIDDELFELVIDIVDNKLWWCGLNEKLTDDIPALCNNAKVPYVKVNNKHRSGDEYPLYWSKQDVKNQSNYDNLVEAESYDIKLYEYIKENYKRPF